MGVACKQSTGDQLEQPTCRLPSVVLRSDLTFWSATHLRRTIGRRRRVMVRRCPQPSAELVVLLDANGRIGSILSPAVGESEPQEEDAGGELLHDFLCKCELAAANTFDGTGLRTWVSTRGQEARIGYVIWPQRWAHHTAPCWNDHRLVLAKFVIRERTCHRAARRWQAHVRQVAAEVAGLSRALATVTGLCPAGSG